MIGAAWLLLAACAERPAPPPGLPPDLAQATLAELVDRRAALEGRDDLASVDARRLVQLAWRNRSPAQVSEDLTGVPPEDREEEAALRRAWRAEHWAFSWDNRNPDAQMEPRPEGTSLTWLVLAAKLPYARNQQGFDEPWIADYFERKSWYVARGGPLALSIIDQVQMERLRAELESLPADRLEAWRDSLPRPGMSPEEAALEATLAAELLAVRAEAGG